jgi:hypothetical protein
MPYPSCYGIADYAAAATGGAGGLPTAVSIVSEPTTLEPATAALRDALRAYAQAAMSALRKVCPEEPAALDGDDEWRRDTDGVFRLHPRERPFWVECLRRYGEQLHGLPEYRPVVDALRAVPYASELLDQLLGSAFSRFRMETAKIADRILWRMAAVGGFSWDDDQFDQSFQELDRDLRRRTISYVCLVPLLGARAESVPIALAADLQIDRMTDEEIGRCLSVNMLPDAAGGPPRIRLRLPELAVRLRYIEPLGIGDDYMGGLPEAMARQALIVDRLFAVLAALRDRKTINGGV